MAYGGGMRGRPLTDARSAAREDTSLQVYGNQGYTYGGLAGPKPLPHTQIAIDTAKQQADTQKMLIERLFGGKDGGGILDQLLGGMGMGTSQPGYPEMGGFEGFMDMPGINQPGFPEFGPTGGPGSIPPGPDGMPITQHGSQPGFPDVPPGQPGFQEDPVLGMPITAHGSGQSPSGVPIAQRYGDGRRIQMTEDFNNLAKSAQTTLIQRGFGGSSLTPDTFAEIGKQKQLSMNELNDQLFREQLQYRAAERAPMFSILQSLLGGMF